MKIPYVIDNETWRMADVLDEILSGHGGRSLDVATAYFNVQGFRLLRDGLLGLGSFRLLLGDEPADGTAVGLRPRAATTLRGELNAAPYSEEMLRAVEDLIAFLRRPNVAVRAYLGGFLHAKAYLFYGDRPTAGWDRFRPVAAIVGSSNLTGPGLTTTFCSVQPQSTQCNPNQQRHLRPLPPDQPVHPWRPRLLRDRSPRLAERR